MIEAGIAPFEKVTILESKRSELVSLLRRIGFVAKEKLLSGGLTVIVDGKTYALTVDPDSTHGTSRRDGYKLLDEVGSGYLVNHRGVVQSKKNIVLRDKADVPGDEIRKPEQTSFIKIENPDEYAALIAAIRELWQLQNPLSGIIKLVDATRNVTGDVMTGYCESLLGLMGLPASPGTPSAATATTTGKSSTAKAAAGTARS